VIGEVVALRDRFNWFERLPLFGKRIVVTRDRRQAMELAEPLEALGAETLLLPVIKIRAAADAGPLDQAIERLGDYDWIIFTSANGVAATLLLNNVDQWLSKRVLRDAAAAAVRDGGAGAGGRIRICARLQPGTN
jgi:uroporphyrinogen III methyltransferase/synthase